MKKMLHRIFIAGNHNNFKPHFLTEAAALGVIAVFVGILSLINAGGNIAFKKADMLGDVYPAIVASLTNDGRKADNLSALAYNTTLEDAARRKAQDMVEKSYFAHVGPGNKQPWDWIRESGYSYEYAGENLAINFSDSIDVYRAWMNSPSHRANILNRHFTEVGIAIATTTIQGRPSVIVVEMFGKAKVSSVTAAPKVAQPIRQVPVATSTATSALFLALRGDTASSSVATTSTSTLSLAPTRVLGAATDEYPLSEEPLPTKVQNTPPTTMSSSIIDEKGNVTSQISNTEAAVWGAITSPRTLSLVVYIFFMILLNIAVIGFGFVDYHKHHKKSIFIAIFLFVALTLISSIYIGFNPEVIVI